MKTMRRLFANKIFVLALTVWCGETDATFLACQSRSSGSIPIVASGYDAQLILDGLNDPRGIKFDLQDRLLVVEEGYGIRSYSISSSSNCTSASGGTTLVEDSTLNHGIELSADGQTLYASSSDSVFSWKYNGITLTEKKTVITNMTNTDHVTRTLLMSKKLPGTLIVTRGSAANDDPLALQRSSGHSQVKAFNVQAVQNSLDFNTQGILLGWGLRNDVGVDEHPTTGGIFSVENSVDEMSRNGIDIHEDNPAEELNFLGFLNGTTSPNEGSNFGYPRCFTAWNVSAIPNNKNITVGSQFAIGDATPIDDNDCQQNYTAPRLAFQAHMAPLDILFDLTGNEAWITFHGSWDREPAVGYKLSLVQFRGGEPLAVRTSQDAAIDILSNPDTDTCDDSGNGCFRPVGLAWDSRGRLFMSSDATGEIFMVTREKNNQISPTSTLLSSPAPTSPTSASVLKISNGFYTSAGVLLTMLVLL